MSGHFFFIFFITYIHIINSLISLKFLNFFQNSFLFRLITLYIFIYILLICLNIFFIYMCPLLFKLFFNIIIYIYNFICFLIFKFSLLVSFSDYSNFKFDIDNTTNTDGEDFLSYLNDFTEISLQERAYFFDWILTNPFEFIFLTSSLFIFNKFLLKKKLRTTSNLFKKN